MRQRMAERDKAWFNALENIRRAIVAVDFGKPDEADTITQRLCLGDVGRQYFANTARFDAAKINDRAKAERGQNGKLMRSVYAVNIERRIGFGKALCLRVRQHLRKVEAVTLHRRQDEIAGPVQYAIYAIDPVGGGTVAQALNHRNTASDGSFKFERGLRAFGQSRQFSAVMGDHGFVGCDQGTSVCQRFARQCQRWTISPAHQFNDDIDILSGRQFAHVVDPAIAGQINTPVFGPVARGDGNNLDFTARPARDQGAIFFKKADDAGSYCPKTSQTYLKRGDTRGNGHRF